VDASRDLRALRAAADRRGLTVAYAADTHLHADFLSGAVQPPPPATAPSHTSRSPMAKRPTWAA
jgi:glyoxylase-like metal-dependent hydrolase (beta-lactamase superfamily II)